MPVQSKMIDYPSNRHTTPGFLAEPEQAGSYPGLVVIQEWWGLVPHIKDVAQRFAGEGYVALAPDLYYGETASEPDEARKLSMDLDRDRAVHEIQAAIQYLRGLDAVSPKKIGVVGWCMGGSLTIATAASTGTSPSELGAVVVFYGSPRGEGIVEKVKIPMLGLYGENDHGIPPEEVKKIEAGLSKSNVPHKIMIYPDAGHAFFNDTRPNIYQPEAAQDAWDRTLKWFNKYLVD